MRSTARILLYSTGTVQMVFLRSTGRDGGQQDSYSCTVLYIYSTVLCCVYTVRRAPRAVYYIDLDL